MADKTVIDWIALVLLIIGGLNWAFYALGWNLVNKIFGTIPILENIIYYLVGISALYFLYYITKK